MLARGTDRAADRPAGGSAPGARQRRYQSLTGHPELHNLAVDEFVRYSSPVAHIGRTAMADAEIAGCPVPRGSRVLLSFGSANRDDRVFPRADEVLVDRHPNKHVGFGIGPHRCIGSHLAKLQIKVALQELLAVMPPFLVHDHGQTHWVGSESRMIDRLIIEVEPPR